MSGPEIRVLHLLLGIQPGGVMAYLHALLDAFRGAADVRFAGAAVHAGTPLDGFAEPPHLGLPTLSYWRNSLRFLRHIIGAIPRAHLVQIHSTLYGMQFVLGAPLCWVLRVPYLVTPHNALAPSLLTDKAFKKWLFLAAFARFFLRKAAGVIATSPLEAQLLARQFPQANVRLALAGTAVPEHPQVEFLRENPTGELRLLYLGAFNPWKRVPSLIRVVAALRKEGIDAQLTIGGYGPAELQRPVDEEIARCGVQSAVSRAGYVTGARKLALIRRAHVLVLPSATDSYSQATAEALAEGLPVVITEGAGAAPEVRRHACGTVVPIDDERALLDAVRAYREPARRDACAVNAHRYAQEMLGLPAFRARMTALYREYARPSVRGHGGTVP